MRIGILEIMPIGHFTLVESVAQIFASDPKNNVFICTHSSGANIVYPLVESNSHNISIVQKKEGDSLKSFLSKIKEFNFDRIYITTLEKYFSEIDEADWGCPVYLFIHNIDEWFQSTSLYQFYHFFRDFSFSPKLVYTIKTSFAYPHLRRKLVKKVKETNGKFVVLNSALKIELSKFIDTNSVEVIPFSIYNPLAGDNSLGNKKLRICIPGMISTTRRDYLSVLKMLESNIQFFKSAIEVDLLGGVADAENGWAVVKEAKKLMKKGITIYLYEKPFVPLAEFDEQLSKADIILANTNIVIDKFSSYGKTKETGIPFTMVRVAKPGIAPEGFILLKELQSSTIFFKDYVHLEKILIDLVTNKDKLKQLKEKAKNNSKLFEPARIYSQLTDTH